MKKENLERVRAILGRIDVLKRLQTDLRHNVVVTIGGERLDFSAEFHARVADEIGKIICEELKALEKEIETL